MQPAAYPAWRHGQHIQSTFQLAELVDETQVSGHGAKLLCLWRANGSGEQGGTLEASLGEHALEAAATEGRVVLAEPCACERPVPSFPRYSSVHLHMHGRRSLRS